MDLPRVEREREALENRLVADIGVEVSYLEHYFLPVFPPNLSVVASFVLLNMAAGGFCFFD